MILNVGSRESKLAIAQTRIITDAIETLMPEGRIELITMKTTGDMILNQSLDQIGGKGLFVKELDMALRENRIDLAVHSLKDMPMEVPEDLPILAYSKREDMRDVLVLKMGLSALPDHPVIGTSSKRRVLQAKKIFPDASFQSIRGNIKTRLEKLDRGEYDGLILAAAGLLRLGLEERIERYFSVDEILPSAGQGILAIQGRSDFCASWMKEINDLDSMYQSRAERAFVAALDGGCTSPTAACATLTGDQLILKGLYYKEDDLWIKGQTSGSKYEAETLGNQLAEELKGQI